MYLSFLSFSGPWKHSISPSTSFEPGDPWWFITQLSSWMSLNEFFILVRVFSSFPRLTCSTVFRTYSIINAFPCIKRDYSYYSIQRIMAFFLRCSITWNSDVTYPIFIPDTFYFIGCRDH